jgi:hypothetical protein
MYSTAPGRASACPSDTRCRVAAGRRRLGAATASALVAGSLLAAAPALAADTTPPSVSWKAPQPGGTLTGTYYNDTRIEATATDDVGVDHVDFRADGVFVNTERSAPYTGNWDTTKVADGRHVLTATAFDAAGNSTSASLEVVVANGAAGGPTVTWKAPTDGRTVSGNLNGGTACEVTATKGASSVSKVEFLLDGTLLNTELTAPYTCYFDTRKVADGTHVLTAKATDSAGRVTSSSITVTVANGPGTPPPPPPPPPPPTPTPGGDPVIAAAGDIACSPSDPYFNAGKGTKDYCRQMATSDLLVGKGLAKVLALGDEQYDNGELSGFQKSYDPSWGRVKSITAPVAGNHEYNTSGAKGYYDYFGALAGARDKGYYSYDIGAWHLIALNSNISRDSGSSQLTWLTRDLAANASKKCVLAYWHHPRFSGGKYGANTTVQPFWKALYDAGADVVLTGHDHGYQRFAPLDASGRKDAARGVRQFVSGAGGRNHYPMGTSSLREAANDDTFGVLKLTLHADSYDWKFEPEAGRTWSDTGTQACH